MLRQAGEPVQAKPCGRALPGLDRTSGFAFRSTSAKRSQTQNRTSHLLFNPDISLENLSRLTRSTAGAKPDGPNAPGVAPDIASTLRHLIFRSNLPRDHDNSPLVVAGDRQW